MKLRVLFSAMMALGLVSSVAMADQAAANENQSLNPNMMVTNTPPDLYGTAPVWNVIIDRNADNAYGEVALYKGQTEVTGEVITDFKYKNNSSGYTYSSANPSSAQFSLYDAEIYVDSQFNSWIRAHLAVDYGTNFTGATPYSSTSTSTSMFFPEAYVTLYGNGNFYAKVGRQYLNFGSSMHDSLTTPLPQTLESVNATAVTAGVVNLLGGLYFDAAVFNGNSYGTGSTANNSAVQANGYVLDLGYTQQMTNQGYNAYVDYIGNFANTLALNYGGISNQAVTSSTNPFSSNLPTSQVGGVAVHGDYHTGPFAIMGDYVSAVSKFNADQWSYNNSGARPSAYSVEGDYDFMLMNHNSTVMVAYEGSYNLAGFVPMGSSTPLPQTRFLVGYSYALMKNVYLQAEYDNDHDYGTADSTAVNTTTDYAGTNGDNNTLDLRLKVLF
jgi:hypothetical protein